MARKVTFMGTNGLGAYSGVHPALGAAVGVGLGTGTAVVMSMSKNAKAQKYSELGGLAAGALGSLALMVSPKTRGAGFVGLVSAVLNNGVRAVVQMARKPAAGATAGWGIATAAQVPTLGATAAYQVPTLGAVTAQQRQVLQGSGGAGMGANGLPVFQGLASHYGATVMGGGRQ